MSSFIVMQEPRRAEEEGEKYVVKIGKWLRRRRRNLWVTFKPAQPA